MDAGRVNGAIAVRDAMLGKNYNKNHLPKGLATDTTLVSSDNGMSVAGMYLANRPTFCFIAADEYAKFSPVFTMEDKTLPYTVEKDGDKTVFCLSISPLQLTGKVCWTIGDKSGEFNLRTYYDYAKNTLNDENLIFLIERLYRYSESVQDYFA